MRACSTTQRGSTTGVPTPGPETRLPPSNGNQPTNQERHYLWQTSSPSSSGSRRTALATERNKAVKSELKTWIRKFREAADAGDADEAKDALKVASTKLDKAVSKGVIHKNQAANKKSAMAKKAASL